MGNGRDKDSKEIEQKVSLIMPVYNAEDYLERAINSVIQQTYKNFELIIVDDGSSDSSGKISENFAKQDMRIKVFHTINYGASTARNFGLKKCSGKYLLFVDADDILHSNALEEAVKNLNQNKADVTIFGWNIIDEEGKYIKSVIEEEVVTENREQVLKKILENYSAFGGGYPWNKLWRIDTYQKADGTIPKFKDNISYFEDLEWVTRMILRTRRVSVCSQSLYSYFYISTSLTRNPKRRELRELDYHRAIQDIILVIRKENPELSEWFELKYIPEIVNGVINAKREKYHDLQLMLMDNLRIRKKKILLSNSISWKIKIRCCFLMISEQFGLL